MDQTINLTVPDGCRVTITVEPALRDDLVSKVGREVAQGVADAYRRRLNRQGGLFRAGLSEADVYGPDAESESDATPENECS